MNPAVRVERLTKRFGDFTAVDQVTFDVHPGEIFGFLGPNGAGKTTTIKMLTGLLRATSGTGHVAGFDITKPVAAVKHHIGYMSQQFSLYADLTVDENIVLYAGLYGVTGSTLRDRRGQILRMAGLEDRSDQLTGTLPLGWKQRLALGCAVLHQPSILFLDEPTSGVDPLARRRFWDLIDGLSSRGTTVFVSTHYMEEAEYCHRLALMNRGRLIALNTPHALRSAMTEPILALEIDHPARGVEALRRVDGVQDVAMYGRDLHVVVSDEQGAKSQLPQALQEHGLSCRNLRRIDPSLEDVFVARVRAEGGAVVG